MNDEIMSTNLVVNSVEDKGQQIKFKGSDNRTYSFWKNKRDGGTTVAYQSFQNFKVGDTICVNYKDVPYKDTTIHSVVSIKPASGVPTPSQSQNNAPRANFSATGAAMKVIKNSETSYIRANDQFGRRLALHGFINARLVNHTVDQVSVEIDRLLMLEDLIEEKLSGTPGVKTATVHTDEVDVEGIPF